METARNTMQSDNPDKIFLELANKTKGLSPVEKIVVISEVGVLERPKFHTYDIHYNGLYVKEGMVIPWEIYAMERIRELQRRENHKNKPLYQ